MTGVRVQPFVVASSNGVRIAGRLASATDDGIAPPVLVLCHGFPFTPLPGASRNDGVWSLAPTLAGALGSAAVAFHFRGVGRSDGDFSLDGWRDDLGAVLDTLAVRPDVGTPWLLGVSTGGAVALAVAAARPEIAGVVTVGTPSSFTRMASRPAEALANARRLRMVRTPGYPPDLATWAAGFARLDPPASASLLAPRPLLVVHGERDTVVGARHARRLAAAAGVEPWIVEGGAHRVHELPAVMDGIVAWLRRRGCGPAPQMAPTRAEA